MSTAAIVPAFNESDRIEATIEALRGIESLDEIIVVDDRSTDATAALATAAGARVVTRSGARGKGAALRAGVDACRADVVVFIDADLGPTAAIARDLVAVVAGGVADVAVAAPPRAGPSGFGIVETCARAGVRALTGVRLERPLSGQRALTREAVDSITFDPGFGIEVGASTDLLRAGMRLVEVPVAFDHRRTGRDLAGFRHRARQGKAVAGALLRRAFRGRRRNA